MAVLSFVGGVLMWFQYRTLDAEEDQLNALDTGEFFDSTAVTPTQLTTGGMPTEKREKEI